MSPKLTGLLPSSEYELLLEAALAAPQRAGPAFDTWLETVDLRDELDWDVVHLLPLVFHNQKALGAESPVLGRFRGVHRRIWYQNQQTLQVTRPAVTLLQNRGIYPLILDDTALAFAWYASPGLRPISHLDILVPRAEVARAIRILGEANWQASAQGSEDDLRFADHVSCLGPGNAQVRIHWEVIPGTPSIVAHPGGVLDWPVVAVRRIDSTSQLLRTIVHSHRVDDHSTFHWVPDAFMLLSSRGDAIAWPRLLTWGASGRLMGRLAAALGYLGVRFGVELPANVRKALSGHRAGLLELAADAVIRVRAARPNQPVQPDQSLGSEFLRYLERTRRVGNPLKTALDFSHVLRYRWRLSGRRQILPALLRSRANHRPFWSRP